MRLRVESSHLERMLRVPTPTDLQRHTCSLLTFLNQISALTGCVTFSLAAVFLQGLSFQLLHMETVRDTDEISETAVTSIYCTFAWGRGCACVWRLIPLTPQGRVCFLPCSLNAETEAQRSDLVSPCLRSHQIMESGLETRAPFLEPNCYFKKLLDDFARWGP